MRCTKWEGSKDAAIWTILDSQIAWALNRPFVLCGCVEGEEPVVDAQKGL